jgi:hypothetical protein
MSDLKTSIVGILTGVIGLLCYFHVGVPAVCQSGDFIALVAAVGVAIIGLFAKDAKKPATATAADVIAAAKAILAQAKNTMPLILIAGLAVALVGCAGVEQQQPQEQRAGDRYGTQYPAITYNITVSGSDSAVVSVSLGQSAQDASQQGSTEQGQAATTGAVDNKPTVSPNIAPTVSVPLP